MSDPIVHTISRTVTAGGITEYPSSAEVLAGHLGETLEAGDGTPTNVWRSSKTRWRLTWDSPRPEVVERWRTRYSARSTFAFVGPYGESFAALIPVGGYQLTATFLPSSSTAAGTTYSLTVEVWQV